MDNPYHPSPIDAETLAAAPAGGRPLFVQYPWLPYVLPLAVFMLVGSFEPKPVAPGDPAAGALPYSAYPAIYTLKIALTLAAVCWVWPAWRQFPRRISGLSILVGIVGAFVWVGVWKLGLEERWLVPLGAGKLLGLGTRSAYNPLAELSASPAMAYGFLAVRLFGLACVIAAAEELFLRGFVMRFMVRPDWWNVPIGEVTPAAVAAGTIVPMLMHPAELFAAACWFSLVTWLMVRTRSIWDCVAAHAVTNLLLGCYVLWSGEWALW